MCSAKNRIGEGWIGMVFSAYKCLLMGDMDKGGGACWDVICFEYIWLCSSQGHHRVASLGFELGSWLAQNQIYSKQMTSQHKRRPFFALMPSRTTELCQTGASQPEWAGQRRVLWGHLFIWPLEGDVPRIRTRNLNPDSCPPGTIWSSPDGTRRATS